MVVEPLVTVVIPFFNDGQYIDEAVGSIFGQTYKNVEIIIVNDGSTDPASIEKITNYQKPNTRIIHQTNQGGAAARNTGFRSAQTEYVLTLDGDDMFEPSFLEEAVQILGKNSQIGAVSSWAKGFGQDEFIWKLEGGNLDNFILGNNCVSCALVRKKLWEEIGGYDENMRNNYEDWDFWIRLTGSGYLVYVIPKLLFLYRQKSTSTVKHAIANHYKIRREIVRKNLSLFQPFLLRLLDSQEERIVNLSRSILEIEMFGLAPQNNKEKIFKMILQGDLIIGWSNLFRLALSNRSVRLIMEGLSYTKRRLIN
jgi:hypothetical protein